MVLESSNKTKDMELTLGAGGRGVHVGIWMGSFAGRGAAGAARLCLTGVGFLFTA